MHIKIKNKSDIELEVGSTAFDLSQKLNLKGPNQSLGAQINGQNKDLSTELKEGDEVHFWSFDEPEGKEIYWHTSAHVLAQAVLRLFPDAQPTIGPPIENGFYYDFANLKISDTDFQAIEKEMQSIIKENLRPKRLLFTSKEKALDAFQGNPFKCDLIASFEEGSEITAYEQGDFFDLCRGPHLPNLGKIKALKVLKTSGAYWRGDSSQEVLTRIYAITFPDRKLLKDYLFRIEQAKLRDHRIVGPRLGLFMLREEAPGLPFILPHGMLVWNQLIDYWREIHTREGYTEIKTPLMMTRELWETSGHWANYRENMYTCEIENKDFAIKPMNCPGCMLYYKSEVHSYKELPLKVAELGLVHRYEHSGAISGLFRVRGFHQDDAHIFMQPCDIKNEILKVLKMAKEIYSLFDLDFTMELSTRPEKDTIGTDNDWEVATKGLQEALDETGEPYRINAGDGAFYGPKIDFHIKDTLGRTWQCGTIQLDMALPEKFELEYVNSDAQRIRPVMIHRALFGSIERFFGILIEHFAGKFPLWLSPRQIRLIVIADRHAEYAKSLKESFSSEGLICKVDESHESVSKKIRSAQLDQVNYILTIGDKEVENKTIALRTRDNVVHGEISVEEFVKKVKYELQHRELTSPFANTQK
ncbi:MAG: Threonine--tRNA ligase 2 [Chlamydiae bacterium]|nr:Threonine--tRNA ligase 2 [Chlamydiota bacterium]